MSVCEQVCPRTCAFVGTDMDKPTQILKTSKVQQDISVCVHAVMCLHTSDRVSK